MLRHEKRHTLRFAPLESDLGRAIRTRHPEVGGVDSMIWVEGAGGPRERVLTRSAAALEVARYMGGAWRLVTIGRFVPRTLRDAAYDFIARHRHRIAKPADQCYLPPPDVRARFIA